MSAVKHSLISLLLTVTFCLLFGQASAETRELRVCSDPNNLPFSDKRGQGFENKLAELVAAELDARLTYTWWAQRRGFIRNTLKADRCDLVMGVPAGYELVATTEPYYRSAYVFVYRRDRNLDLSSIKDSRLKELRIGAYLVGDDGSNTPPIHALGEQGIVDNVNGYMIYGDYAQPHPGSRLIDAVASGEVDVAAVWGPLGGYFAKQSSSDLVTVPITDTEEFDQLSFSYSIAMGVRKDDKAFKNELNHILERNRERIHSLLDEYGVPVVKGTSG